MMQGESRIVTPDAPQRPVPSKNQSIQRFEVTCRKGNSSTFPIAGLALYKVLLLCKRGMKSGIAMRAQYNARRVCNGRECNRPVDDTRRTDRARRRRSQPISTSSESASAVRNACNCSSSSKPSREVASASSTTWGCAFLRPHKAINARAA